MVEEALGQDDPLKLPPVRPRYDQLPFRGAAPRREQKQGGGRYGRRRERGRGGEEEFPPRRPRRYFPLSL